jgi:hypothetical protein
MRARNFSLISCETTPWCAHLPVRTNIHVTRSKTIVTKTSVVGGAVIGFFFSPPIPTSTHDPIGSNANIIINKQRYL